MLQGINRLGKSWVGKVVVGILFGFLILSFAIWGIGDIFRGQVRTHVATVGKVDVSAEAYRSAYQTEYQNLIRQSRQSITPEQARALGLDQRVLGRLVTEAALDQRAREMGLAVSDQQVIQSIQQDPNFRGPNGQFDRSQFNDLLRGAGYSEAQYLREQRAVAARLQLAEAVVGAAPVPLALREAVHRYQAERRTLDYVVIAASALGELSAPTDAELLAFYESHKTLYRAPEYRALNVLALDPATLAKPDAVPEADARAFYERVKDTRFGTPEKRTIQQIVFLNADEAAAASQRLKGGAAFEEIAKERAIDDATLNLGTLTRAEMIDPAAADAAFGLAEGAVSEPVEGRFGPVLLRVTKIEPGSLKPYEEVAGEAKRELALQRARDEVQKVHDAIEDQRAGARPLADIAKERGLPLARIEMDRQVRDKTGQPATALPEAAALAQAAFRSDVGADNEAVRTRDGGYIWYEVASIEGARDRPIDQVRERVVADQRQDRISRGLTDKARDIVSRLDSGADFGKTSEELGTKIETSGELVRGAASGDLTRAVVTRAFATPVGKAADASGGEDRRVVFRVTKATMAPFVTTTQEASAIEDQLRGAIADDLLAEYLAQVQKQVGVRTFPDNARRAIGAEL